MHIHILGIYGTFYGRAALLALPLGIKSQALMPMFIRS